LRGGGRTIAVLITLRAKITAPYRWSLKEKVVLLTKERFKVMEEGLTTNIAVNLLSFLQKGMGLEHTEKYKAKNDSDWRGREVQTEWRKSKAYSVYFANKARRSSCPQ